MSANPRTETGWDPRSDEAAQLTGAAINAGRPEVVIAGLDGSAAARSAADWAAQEAARRHAPLRLVHAYSLPTAGYHGYRVLPPELESKVRTTEQGLLDRAATDIGRLHPHLEISTCLTRD